MSNVIELSVLRAARPLPPENIRPLEVAATKRQQASRRRNALRHPCNKISLAVTVAGRIQRREPLGYHIDGAEALREGASAARRLAIELDSLAEQHSKRAQQ